MSKNKATAVIDVDGVICNFEEAFCDAFGRQNRHLYKLEDRYPHLYPDLIAEWVNCEDNYVNLSPIFGGILLIQQLKDRGFDVVLMTSRNAGLRAVTEAWLKLYNIEVEQLVFSKDKANSIYLWNDSVGAPYGEIKCTLFVDDSVSQLESVKKLNPSVTCLAWQQPWNRGWYPALRYNGNKYLIEGNNGTSGWKSMWSK